VPKDFAKNFGCIVSNEANEILHYAEKPETFVSDIISCGIYVFSPEVFDKLGEAFTANNAGYSLQTL
jgi:mannose-1-phosphate guanylyltransferase